MSDGLDGIHIGSLLGRDVAKEDADEDANEERHVDGPGGNAAGHPHHGYEEGANTAAHKNTYQSSRNGYQHRLDEGLQRDNRTRGKNNNNSNNNISSWDTKNNDNSGTWNLDKKDNNKNKNERSRDNSPK